VTVARDIDDARKRRIPALSSGPYIKYEGWILGKILLDKNWAGIENLQVAVLAKLGGNIVVDRGDIDVLRDGQSIFDIWPPEESRDPIEGGRETGHGFFGVALKVLLLTVKYSGRA
jgi:hypothetical protein